MSDDTRRIQGDPSIELVVDLAQPSAEDRAIDVGTGVGSMAFALARTVASVDAVDDRQDTVDEARRLLGEVEVDNLTFTLANLYALPFPDQTFSLAVCRNAIHRFPEPVAALREMARVIAPGGRLVIYDIVVADDVDRSLNELARLTDSGHRRHERREEFLEHFARAGLRVAAERADRSTVDLDYWLEAAAVDTGRADLVRSRLQELPLKVQTALDLVLADRLVSFSYDVIGFRLELT